jgi:hypothetical protein
MAPTIYDGLYPDVTKCLPDMILILFSTADADSAEG